jgi:endonuclease IV
MQINSTTLKQVKDGISAIVVCLDRINSEKEQIKAIVDLVVEQTEISPKHLKSIAAMIQKAKAVERLQEMEDCHTLLSEILGQTS